MSIIQNVVASSLSFIEFFIGFVYVSSIIYAFLRILLCTIYNFVHFFTLKKIHNFPCLLYRMEGIYDKNLVKKLPQHNVAISWQGFIPYHLFLLLSLSNQYTI